MKLNVYNGEVIRRGHTRYAIAIVLLMVLLIFGMFGSLWAKGGDDRIITLNNILNVVIILALAVGYRYFELRTLPEETVLEINDGGIQAPGQYYAWTELKGFVVEVDIDERAIKNLVLLTEDNHAIFSLNDSLSSLEAFIEELGYHIPQCSTYPQTVLEKVMRLCKI